MNYTNFNLQPGDATRYQIMLSTHRDGVLVAIGTSEKVSGGGLAIHSTLDHVPDYLMHLANRRVPLIHSGHRDALDYFIARTGLDNAHTGLVALTMAWLFRNSPIGLDKRSAIIGYAYKGMADVVEAGLEVEVIAYLRPLPNISWDDLLLKCLNFPLVNMEPEDIDPEADDSFHPAEAVSELYDLFRGDE